MKDNIIITNLIGDDDNKEKSGDKNIRIISQDYYHTSGLVSSQFD